MSDNTPRTDLACESMGETPTVDGVKYREEMTGGFRFFRMEIVRQAAAELLHKPMGHYITVECGKITELSEDRTLLLSHLLAEELRSMAERVAEKRTDSEFGILVIGLGNAELTADAVGPETVSRLTATRHLREHETALYRQIGCCALSALSPGVLGQTGIETVELIRGAVRYVRPDVLLVIDALAARSCDRLASTIQISDAGIEPGSGVGNYRAAITKRSVGVPVIALGVPTVVNSATLVSDALHKAGIGNVGGELERVLRTGESFFVSPKECDLITHRFASLFSDAVGMAFTGNL